MSQKVACLKKMLILLEESLDTPRIHLLIPYPEQPSKEIPIRVTKELSGHTTMDAVVSSFPLCPSSRDAIERLSEGVFWA